MSGLTAESLKVSGRIIKWKAMVFLPGQMEEDMKENILMIKKKETECFTGTFSSQFNFL
jgi:hypothetical protein